MNELAQCRLDGRDDTTHQAQDLKFETWQLEVEHATSLSRISQEYKIITS